MNFYNFLQSNFTGDKEIDNYENYLKLNQTRIALHVEGVKYWVGNETVFKKLSSDIILSVMENMTALIPNYKVMLFVGNLDMIIGPAQINTMLENKGKFI